MMFYVCNDSLSGSCCCRSSSQKLLSREPSSEFLEIENIQSEVGCIPKNYSQDKGRILALTYGCLLEQQETLLRKTTKPIHIVATLL